MAGMVLYEQERMGGHINNKGEGTVEDMVLRGADTDYGDNSQIHLG